MAGLDRVLGLSSKRVTHGHQVFTDLPCLEFTTVARKSDIQTLFQPHEMQWSIEEYLKQGEQMSEEGERRLASTFRTSGKDVREAFEKLHEGSERREQKEAVPQFIKEAQKLKDQEEGKMTWRMKRDQRRRDRKAKAQ